jgi:hypothetical protein
LTSFSGLPRFNQSRQPRRRPAPFSDIKLNHPSSLLHQVITIGADTFFSNSQKNNAHIKHASRDMLMPNIFLADTVSDHQQFQRAKLVARILKENPIAIYYTSTLHG